MELNTKFAKSIEADYPILSDPGKKVAKAYGVVTAKRQFPFRWTFYIGKDGKILKIDKAVKAGIDGETALRGTNEKFRRRFHFIERELNASGSRLEDASLDEMEELWQRAKAAE